MKVPSFADPLRQAVESGLLAAALVDRNGKTVDLAGEITEDEAMPLAALVMYRLKSDDLADRLFAGEVISLALDDRDVAVAIARRQLFVVAILGTAAQLATVEELRDVVARSLTSEPPNAPRGTGSGGSGSGPAELPVIELGITVRRERAKA
jgi:hypothetical protein